LRGFYVQDAGDGDPATSDGVFVFGADDDRVAVGDLVTVSGTAGEFQGQTQISSSTVTACGTSSAEPVSVTLPAASATALERYEGMLVRMPQPLTVTETFQLGRFGQVVVSSGGRLTQPTNVVAPGAAANALQASNALNRLIVDDATNAQNPDPIVFGRGGQPLSASNTLRGGDTVTGAIGVLTYTWAGNAASGNAYRLRPVGALGGAAEFAAVNERPTTPSDVGGSIRVAGLNLLNYFTTFDGLPDRVDNCRGGTQGAATDCRGADTPEEFARQWPKTVAEILTLDADVVGVNEIENNGFGPGSAIAHLVDRLNEATAPGTYAFVDADAATGVVDVLGTDAIKVGLVYKPGVLTPVGRTAVLNTPEFVNGGDSSPRGRPSLAQAFEVDATGAVFTVDVNHLKSKGSACEAPDAGDGQGNCNVVRTNAARALAAWLAGDPTGTGDDDVILVGDYNSYAKEDPIGVLEGAGFTNLVPTLLGDDAYSYVFDGQWGSLDHALVSESMRGQVTGVTDHHVNADEPPVLDYNTDFKSPGQLASLYAPDRYRMSDHDPVLVGLTPNAPPTATAAFEKALVECGKGNASLAVDLADPDAGDTHEITVVWGDGSSETVTAPAGPGGSLSVAHTYAKAGRYTATVTVRDSAGNSADAVTAAVAVAYDAALLSPREGRTVSVPRGATVPVAVLVRDCGGSVPGGLTAPTVTVTLGDKTISEAATQRLGPLWAGLVRTRSFPADPGPYTVTVTVPDTGQSVTSTLRLRR
ncbi:MAG: ExeM/NucH family extracellular endonuclease, partial [Dermatophilaceae bacterium]